MSIEPNKIYSNIKVLSMKENKGNGKIYYNCQLIDTGEFVILRSDIIKKYENRYYSIKKDAISIGKVYNNILVLSLHHNDHGKKYFECTCNECIKSEKCKFILRSDNIKSNSRTNKYKCIIEKSRDVKEDLTGNVYGNLLVLGIDHIKKGKGSY